MIGYRKLDGSTVLPDGTIVYANGTRSAPGASKYPPAAEIGGLHPVTLPDPAPSPLGGLIASIPEPAPIYTAEGAGDRVRDLELSLERASAQYATEKRRTIALGVVAALGVGTAVWFYARKR